MSNIEFDGLMTKIVRDEFQDIDKCYSQNGKVYIKLKFRANNDLVQCTRYYDNLNLLREENDNDFKWIKYTRCV